jgi:hypothetical protein
MPFECDAEGLRVGAIVLIESPLSSAGTPTYPHYFVVVHVPQRLVAGSRIGCVGVSSRISDAAFDPELHVPMRWMDRKNGHPETGFSKPCHAVIAYPQALEVTEGEDGSLVVAAKHDRKFVRADHLQAIMSLSAARHRKRQIEQERKRRKDKP